MLSILSILLGTKRRDKTSERREQAGSRRIATILQKHDSCGPASRHRFPKFVTDKNEKDQMATRMELRARWGLP